MINPFDDLPKHKSRATQVEDPTPPSSVLLESDFFRFFRAFNESTIVAILPAMPI